MKARFRRRLVSPTRINTAATTASISWRTRRYGAKWAKRTQPAGSGGVLRVADAPPDRNLAPFGIDGGLVCKGLIPSRDWDSLGLAVSYIEISDDIRDAQDDVNALVGARVLPSADYEAVIELSYKAQLTAWWTLQPSRNGLSTPGPH